MRISPRSFFPARSYVAVACSSPLLRFIPPATPTVIFLRYYCMFQSSSTFHIATTPDRHPPTTLLYVPFPFYVSYLQQPRPLSSYVTIACSNPLLRFISPLPPTAILLRCCCMFHSPSTFHTSSNPDRYLPTLLLHVQILFYVSYRHSPRPPSSYDAVVCSIPLLRFIPPATPTVIFLRYYCMFKSSSTFHINTTPDRHPPTTLLHVPFPFCFGLSLFH
jgi:hypothetical protein